MKEKFKTRKNLRISDYNYSSSGYYFITICTESRKNILSEIIYEKDNIKLKLLNYGKIVEKCIKAMNNIYDDIKITYYVIMPNHIHFICEIENKNNNNKTRTNQRIPFLVSTLKRLTNKEIRLKIWQRNYYEHVIRNEKEYLKIIEYIQNNPYQWAEDKYYN